MLGEIQLDRPVVESIHPRLLHLRHCTRRTRRRRPTDEWQVSSLGTVQGLQPVKRRDSQSPSCQVLSNADDGECSDFHSMDWLWRCMRIARKECR